jgi:hypothetical protein
MPYVTPQRPNPQVNVTVSFPAKKQQWKQMTRHNRALAVQAFMKKHQEASNDPRIDRLKKELIRRGYL